MDQYAKKWNIAFKLIPSFIKANNYDDSDMSSLLIMGGGLVRKTLLNIIQERNTSELINEKLKEYDVRVIDSAENYLQPIKVGDKFIGGYECIDWAFNKLGLSSLLVGNEFENEENQYRLMSNQLPEVNWIQKPISNALVFYFDLKPNFDEGYVDLITKHGGIVSEVNGRIIVQSKWGIGGDVYEHPVEMVPSHFGKYVHFFEVNHKNS